GIREHIDRISSQQMVFFTRGDNLANLNNAMLYVLQNEHTNRIKVVTVVKNKSEVPAKLKQDLTMLDEAYPDMDIEFVVLEDSFGPSLIKRLSKEWQIPANLMFMGSPAGQLRFDLAELGGVRLII
ncbi:MAG: APC family permease, partial [Planctomycetota bacterium]